MVIKGETEIQAGMTIYSFFMQVITNFKIYENKQFPFRML